MPMVEVLQGTKFGRLTYVGRATVEQVRWKRRHAQWRCDCGTLCVKPIGRVKSGMVRSCGCLVADAVRAANTTHGCKYTREYRIWNGMRNRCSNANEKDYPRYGGKGIRVCTSWLLFENFIADMGPCPSPSHSIDRIDGKRNYEPGNCRWATPQEQQRNKHNITFIKTPKGVMAIVDYAAFLGITNGAAHQRLKRGKLEGCTPCQ